MNDRTRRLMALLVCWAAQACDTTTVAPETDESVVIDAGAALDAAPVVDAGTYEPPYPDPDPGNDYPYFAGARRPGDR